MTLRELYLNLPTRYEKRTLYVNQVAKAVYVFMFTTKSYTREGNIIRVNGIVNEMLFTVIHTYKLSFLFKRDETIRLCGTVFAKSCYYPGYQDLRLGVIPIYKGSKPELISKLIDDNPLEDELLNTIFRKIHAPREYNEINDGFNMLLLMEIYFAIKILNYSTSQRDPLVIYDHIETRCPLIPRDNQISVINNIYEHLRRNTTMNCLLYGDVGSGKTFVSFRILMQFVANGKRVAFMAPTGVLATQVYNLFKEWTDGVCLLTNKSRKVDESASIFVGTHALLYASLPKIDLLIIDEQHKFGVNQRNKIVEEHNCDCLMMTATPIPRTFQMIMSRLIQFEQLGSIKFDRNIAINDDRDFVLSRVMGICATKAVLWVLNNIERATEFYEELSTKCENVYLLHSKIKNKDEILSGFKSGILISTTVIEVGIDLDIFAIVIEGANGFGVSQLHQLCGRVGRRGDKSHIIFLDKSTDKLRRMKEVEDGWSRSEFDYHKRGGGTIHNVRQSGFNPFVFNKQMDETGELMEIPIDNMVIDVAQRTSYDDKYKELFVVPNADV
jgi:ATP-dependent DNA helicase RecG